MAGIRFTKAEREAIRVWALGELGDTQRVDIPAKVCQAILDKLEKSEMVKTSARPTGIGWAVAAQAMRDILGARLAVPPNPDIGWIVKMNNRIRDLGLSVMDCKSIAKVQLAKGWKVYSFEKTIWAADTLLQEAQLDIPATRPREAAPLSM